MSRHCLKCNREASRRELETGECLRCAARKRMLELARVVRSAENSEPLTELLDLLELWEGTYG